MRQFHTMKPPVNWVACLAAGWCVHLLRCVGRSTLDSRVEASTAAVLSWPAGRTAAAAVARQPAFEDVSE